MALNGGHVNVASDSHEEHDHVEYRKRVATYADGKSVAYEDTSFVTGDSPAVLDVFTDAGKIAHKGYICNDGPGAMKIEFSADGTTYGGQHTLYGGEEMIVDELSIKKVRFTYVDTTAYRVLLG